MDTELYEQAKDVYAMYRSGQKIDDINPDREQAIIQSIYNSLDVGAATMAEPRLRRLVNDYISNKKSVERNFGEQKFEPVTKEASRIFAFFRTQTTNMWEGFWGGLKNIFLVDIPSIFSRVAGADEAGYDNFFRWLIDSGVVSTESATFLRSVFAKTRSLSGIAPVLVIIGVIQTWITQSTHLLMGDYRKKLNAGFTPESVPVPDLIRALHLAPELSESINKKLGENGLDESDINLTKIASYATYDVTMTQILYWRGILSKEDAENRLSELSFTPDRIREIMASWEVIPSPQDLLWMVGKEAFEPDQIRKFGLDQEFPTDQLKWLNKQGISSEWAMKYWAAHWDYPSEGRVLDLYHRGIISDSDLDAFYRVIEMPPYWRDKLKQASYSLYPRIDLRRMHDLGVVTEEEVYENFRGEGYDDKHAKNMTAFLLKFNELNDKDLSLSQIRKAYESDMITESRAVEMLRGLSYTDEQIDLLLRSIEYDEMVKIQKLRIKSIAKLYKNNIYDRGKVRNSLSSLGVEPKWIEVYIDQWTDEAIVEEKLPPQEDVLKWYASSAIDFSTFVDYLRKMGYSEKTITIYATVYSPK